MTSAMTTPERATRIAAWMSDTVSSREARKALGDFAQSDATAGRARRIREGARTDEHTGPCPDTDETQAQVSSAP